MAPRRLGGGRMTDLLIALGKRPALRCASGPPTVVRAARLLANALRAFFGWAVPYSRGGIFRPAPDAGGAGRAALAGVTGASASSCLALSPHAANAWSSPG